MTRMKLSSEKIAIKNTYETNKLIQTKINKMVHHDKTNPVFLSVIYPDFTVLLDLNDIFYISRVFDITPVSFTNKAILGYIRFNKRFFTAISLNELIKSQPNNQNLGKVAIFFHKNTNVLIVNTMGRVYMNELTLVKDSLSTNKHNSIDLCSSESYLDKNGRFYYLLNKEQALSIL